MAPCGPDHFKSARGMFSSLRREALGIGLLCSCILSLCRSTRREASKQVGQKCAKSHTNEGPDCIHEVSLALLPPELNNGKEVTRIATGSTVGRMVPIILALASALGGVTITALAGLLGAWIQSRREYARWLHEKRYAAYLGLLQELDLDGADIEMSVDRVRRYASEIALLGPTELRSPMGRFVQADTEPDKFDRSKARTAYLEAVQRALHLERPS